MDGMGTNSTRLTDALSLTSTLARSALSTPRDTLKKFAISQFKERERKKTTKISTLGAFLFGGACGSFASHSSGKRGIGRLGLIDRTRYGKPGESLMASARSRLHEHNVRFTKQAPLCTGCCTGSGHPSIRRTLTRRSWSGVT